jgi:uncharacterized protein YcbK (DUF882 family)
MQSPVSDPLVTTSRWARPVVALALGAMLAIGPVYAEAAEVVHVVAKGQTLWHIARRYRTTPEALREVNGLRPGQLLKPGTAIVIPEKGKEAEAAKKAAQLHAAKGEGGKKADAGKGEGKSKDEGKGKSKDEGKGKSKGGKAKGGGKNDRPDKPEPLVQKPKRPGFVKLVRGTEHLEFQLLTKHGRLVPSALPGLSRMLRHGPSNSKTAIDPRLATLIGMVSDHFGGRPLHVVSGYRPFSPTQYTKHSNHNLGRAFDFTVEGVPNTVLRDFCRTFRNAGVGYYPNSTFVHLDVRTTKTFWIDYSRAGEAPRYDSPVAQASADEAAGDVDATPGKDQTPGQTPVKEGETTSPAPEGGSEETQPPPPQPVDSSTGKQRTADPSNAKSL